MSEQDQWDIMPGNCTLVRTNADGAQVWKLRLYAGLDVVSRKQVGRSKTFTVPAGSERIAQRKLAQQALEQQVTADKANVGTVADAVRRYRRHRDRIDSPSTVRGREARLARIETDLGKMKLDALKAHHVDDWYAKLRAETRIVRGKRVRALSETSVHHHHSQLRAVLRYAEKHDMVDWVVTRKADAPPLKRQPIRPPITAVLDMVVADAAPDLRSALEVLQGTGARRGEALALRWTDLAGWELTVARSIVELRGGELFVKLPKSGYERTFTIDYPTMRALARHRRSQRALAAALGYRFDPDGWVFADYAGGRPYDPRKPGWLTLAWQRHCARHGVKIRLHDVRHWNITHMIDQGVSLPTAQHRAGHRQITTTSGYAHVVDESDRAAAKAIGRLRTRPRPKALTAG